MLLLLRGIKRKKKGRGLDGCYTLLMKLLNAANCCFFLSEKKGGVGGVIRECITHTTIDLMYFKLKSLLQQFYGFD